MRGRREGTNVPLDARSPQDECEASRSRNSDKLEHISLKRCIHSPWPEPLWDPRNVSFVMPLGQRQVILFSPLGHQFPVTTMKVRLLCNTYTQRFI